MPAEQRLGFGERRQVFGGDDGVHRDGAQVDELEIVAAPSADRPRPDRGRCRNAAPRRAGRGTRSRALRRAREPRPMRTAGRPPRPASSASRFRRRPRRNRRAGAPSAPRGPPRRRAGTRHARCRSPHRRGAVPAGGWGQRARLAGKRSSGQVAQQPGAGRRRRRMGDAECHASSKSRALGIDRTRGAHRGQAGCGAAVFPRFRCALLTTQAANRARPVRGLQAVNRPLTLHAQFVNQSESHRRGEASVERRSPTPVADVPGALLHGVRDHATGAYRRVARRARHQPGTLRELLLRTPRGARSVGGQSERSRDHASRRESGGAQNPRARHYRCRSRHRGNQGCHRSCAAAAARSSTTPDLPKAPTLVRRMPRRRRGSSQRHY